MEIGSTLLRDCPGFVNHFECSLTGERYASDPIHGLSRAGRPLLPRYNLAEQNEVVLFNCPTGLKYPMPEASHRLDRHQPIGFTP